jgi:hypothetical protein
MPTKVLEDGTPYEKAVNHNDTDLTGVWDAFIKIDGVRALRLADGSVVSRNSKPLYNLDRLDFQDAEIFHNNWNDSVSLVRSQEPKIISQDMVYDLRDGSTDPRLVLAPLTNPSNELLQAMMQAQVAAGNEGIVIRKGKKWIKVVPELTADVIITGVVEGTGRNAGRLGSLKTAHGNIGSGFSDELRQEIWDNIFDWIGTMVEAGYRETTAAGKLRFPTYKRRRLDKDDESI